MSAVIDVPYFRLTSAAIASSRDVVLIPLMIFERLREKPEKSVKPTARESKDEGAKQGLKFGASVPFGPWLALGALLYYVWARPFVDDYFTNLGLLLFP